MKKILRILLVIILLPILYVGGVIGYGMATDYVPEPQNTVDVSGSATAQIAAPDSQGLELSLISWNIGYCGLGEESDFFYDGGKMMRTTQENVQKNLSGVTTTLSQMSEEVDFFLLQEVDKNSHRSYRFNQYDSISSTLGNYAAAFGKNYDVGYVPLPLTNPMRQVLGGVATWSRYQPTEATRYSFEGNYSFPNYLFFLDRCFLVERFPMGNGKNLVLINTHNSAYDGGTLKEKQMEQMKAVLIEEYQKGNYVIVGGDWNQYPPEFTGLPGFSVEGKAWTKPVPKEYPEAGWKWAFDETIATNRSLQTPFNETSMRSVIDFFLLSPNVSLESVNGIDMQFQYSDHQAVKLKVRLN